MSNRPPRPGDPDGTPAERVVFWCGFIAWLPLAVTLRVLGWVLSRLGGE